MHIKVEINNDANLYLYKAFYNYHNANKFFKIYMNYRNFNLRIGHVRCQNLI